MTAGFQVQTTARTSLSAQHRWLLMLPILLLGAWLGMQLISADAIWVDEWYSYYFTAGGEYSSTTVAGTPCEAIPGETHTVIHLLCLVMAVDTGPPLHYLLLMGWGWISGGALSIDRYLSLLTGLLAIAVTYRLARALIDGRTALIAALLLTSSAFFVHYLHELRGYTLFVLFIAAVGLLYWRLQSARKPTRRLRWAFSLAIAGALYTHFVSLPVIAGLGAYHLWFERPRRSAHTPPVYALTRARWVLTIKAGVNGILLFGFWVAVLIITFAKESEVSRSKGLLPVLSEFLFASTNGLWLAGGLLLLISLKFLRERPVRFLWVWLIVSVILVGIGDIAADVLFHPRHILGILPIVITIVATVVDRITRCVPAVGFATIGIWVGVGLVASSSSAFMNALSLHEPPTPLAAITRVQDVVSTCGQPDDALILGLREPDREWVQDAPIMYYFGPQIGTAISYSRLLSDAQIARFPTPLLPTSVQSRGVQARLDYLTMRAERVFVFALHDYPLTAYTLEIDDLLRARAYNRCEARLDDTDMIGLVYATTEAACQQIASECAP